jgi:hypothetical protein
VSSFWEDWWRGLRKDGGVVGDYGHGLSWDKIVHLMGKWLEYRSIYGLGGGTEGLTDGQIKARQEKERKG